MEMTLPSILMKIWFLVFSTYMVINSLLFVTDLPFAPRPTISTDFNMSHFALVNIVHFLCFFFHLLSL